MQVLSLRSSTQLDRRTPNRARASRLRSEMRFGDLLQAWSVARRPAPKTLNGAERAVAQITELIGDVPVIEIVADDLFDYRDAVASLPRALSIAERERGFAKLVEHFAAASDPRPRVSTATVRKQLCHIQALLTFAFRERWIANNVGRDIPTTGCSGRGDRRAFTREEVRAVFALPLFVQPWAGGQSRRQIGDDTLRWLMLIALTTGARIEEIGQLHPGDVQIDEDVVHLVIDELDAAGAKSATKSIKTASSKRRVPLHSDLLKLGLHERARHLGREGAERLFPDLPRDGFGRYTRNASRCCNRLIDQVSSDPRLVFHSFRHFFKDLCREIGMLEYVGDQLTGHTPVSAGGRYGSGVSLSELKIQLERLRFEFVDWERIYAASRA